MSRSVYAMDTPKDCLHCKMRNVIYADGKGYQQCGLNTDGYKLESFFKEEDLKEGWISPKCPLVKEELEKQIAVEYYHTSVEEAKHNTKIRLSICPKCFHGTYSGEFEYPQYCSWCGQKLGFNEV